MTEIRFKQIGTIHSRFTKAEGMPIQPSGAEGEPGHIKLLPEFNEGIDDLDGFSHIILLYYLHESKGFSMKVKPFLDDVKRGVFATRAPLRPNSIGLSIVRLSEIKDSVIYIENVDILDGTPLIDIKPYVHDFDYQGRTRSGWYESAKRNACEMKADKRFIETIENAD